MSVKISEVIAPNFFDVWKEVNASEPKFWEFWLNGGRGSTKSSFISLVIVLLIILNPSLNAVILRKVKDTLRTSVFTQMMWAVNTLGLTAYFKFKTSPLEAVYKPTCQTIYFFGLDDPGKIKGIKPGIGYIGITWCEELDQFDGMEELRNVWQSTERGGKRFWRFCSYNPPISQSVWVNQEAATPKPGRLVHTSNYLTVPGDWLSPAFNLEAEHLKRANERAYRHEYLGEITGTGSNIFPNVKAREILDDEINSFDNLRQGVDWGFVTSAFAFVKWHYDNTRRCIYIFDEIYRAGLLNDAALELVKAKYNPLTPIYADSAEPKSIADFNAHGVFTRPAAKGADSRKFGLRWLQNLDAIYIDPVRCPNAFKEFSTLELARNKDGTFKDEPPKVNDHTIDAVRYGSEQDFVKRGIF